MRNSLFFVRLMLCAGLLSMVFGCTSLWKKTLVIGGNDYRLVFQDDFSNGRGHWEETDAAAWRIEDEGGNPVFSQFQMSKYEPPVRSPRRPTLRPTRFLSSTARRASPSPASVPMARTGLPVFTRCASCATPARA